MPTHQTTMSTEVPGDDREPGTVSIWTRILPRTFRERIPASPLPMISVATGASETATVIGEVQRSVVSGLVPPARLELATYGLEGRCSIH